MSRPHSASNLPIQPTGLRRPWKRRTCGPGKGPKAITRKQAEIIRDDFLHGQNAAESRVGPRLPRRCLKPQWTRDGATDFGAFTERIVVFNQRKDFISITTSGQSFDMCRFARMER
jgi:hypothetical protein